jgi:hypothetical protein
MRCAPEPMSKAKGQVMSYPKGWSGRTAAYDATLYAAATGVAGVAVRRLRIKCSGDKVKGIVVDGS